MSEQTFYEYIVVGLGGVGSGALYWLSRTVGGKVLGLEQFELGHDNGGSQDHSRSIRLNYHEPKYTKQLCPGSYEAWAEVERESGMQLVHKCGSLCLAKKGTTGEKVIGDSASAMTEANTPYEMWSGPELRRRYPQFQCGDDMIAQWQKDGGLVDAALGNALHVQLARGYGAHVLEKCGVQSIVTKENGTAEVHTTRVSFSCRRVVIAAGAWINQVMGSLGVHIPVRVTQEQVTYLGTPNTRLFTKDVFPIFVYHADGNDIYVLPIYKNSGFKIGIDAAGDWVTPNTRTFVPDAAREKRAIDFLKDLLPESVGPNLYTKTCLYTMTLDRDFVIDTLERQGKPQIVFCCGAGHAFKFASILGKILSELAVTGRSTIDIAPFTMDREAVRNPNYDPTFHLSTSTKAKI